MISPLDFIHDLFTPQLAFLPRALVVAALSSVICGVVGCHVVLRGMAFIGEAVAHSVFPGITIAFALQTSLLLGGAVSGIAVALMIAVFSQNRRLREDTLIGVFFAAAFSVGLVVISRTPGYTGSLQSFLFGSLTGVTDDDVVVVAVIGGVVLAVLLLFQRYLVAAGLDRESARAAHLPVFWIDILIYLSVTAAVVMSVRTIGNILVLALLVTPAATARMLTDRLGTMMALAPTFGLVASCLGIYLSWSLAIPTGAAIVLCSTVLFILTWCAAPRRGAISMLVRSWRGRSTTREVA
ncbi:anchored repeat-type ABC transporter permease subunit [Devriesea agamarum]|uniref:anchored repeat-type ABC transporter permease subunit n=1 Tax=Devriesea agamarum TaxID=472569 RepID=UPI00071D4D0F|nr:anchored repeat-type ABC transporter permease subunit [Devriesea agamarum]